MANENLTCEADIIHAIGLDRINFVFHLLTRPWGQNEDKQDNILQLYKVDTV
jgi:hypothetical protein